MQLYQKNHKDYLIYLYGPPHIMKNVFNYKTYIKRLITDLRHNLLTLQIGYK